MHIQNNSWVVIEKNCLEGSTHRVPVVLPTYTRLKHLKQTIKALLNNELAKETPVFIFSDGPKDGDEIKVEAVRIYLSTVCGFDEFHVIAREENIGMIANGIGGVTEILDRYGRTIFMEDDIVTSSGFLTYMNQALEKYQDNKTIFSISGYCPPISIPNSYKQDTFFLKRFNAWGVGIWKDRHDSIRQCTREDFETFSANRKLARAFVKGGGKDMLAMLNRVAHGKLDAYDVRCMYTQFLNGQYTLYPTKSLVQNIGFDGTGVHCGITDRMDVILSHKTSFKLPDQLIIDPRIVRANQIFRNGGTEFQLFRVKIKARLKQHTELFRAEIKARLKRHIDSLARKWL